MKIARGLVPESAWQHVTPIAGVRSIRWPLAVSWQLWSDSVSYEQSSRGTPKDVTHAHPFERATNCLQARSRPLASWMPEHEDGPLLHTSLEKSKQLSTEQAKKRIKPPNNLLLPEPEKEGHARGLLANSLPISPMLLTQRRKDSKISPQRFFPSFLRQTHDFHTPKKDHG